MELGERYWAAVEPYWGSISIYDGADRFLAAFRNTPEVPRNLFAAHWCQSEVCNGGLHQFFTNPTGVLAPEAVAGFQVIGLSALSRLVTDAMAFFGSEYPREQEDRISALDAYAAEHGDAWNPFGDLDDRFYELLRREAGGWEHAADAYALEKAG